MDLVSFNTVVERELASMGHRSVFDRAMCIFDILFPYM
jgi:hypothetical protein